MKGLHLYLRPMGVLIKQMHGQVFQKKQTLPRLEFIVDNFVLKVRQWLLPGTDHVTVRSPESTDTL